MLKITYKEKKNRKKHVKFWHWRHLTIDFFPEEPHNLNKKNEIFYNSNWLTIKERNSQRTKIKFGKKYCINYKKKYYISIRYYCVGIDPGKGII